MALAMVAMGSRLRLKVFDPWISDKPKGPWTRATKTTTVIWIRLSSWWAELGSLSR